MCAWHGGRRRAAVGYFRAQGGEAVHFARISAHPPLCNIEQPVQAVRVEQVRGVQVRRPLF
jgi:hypothetical protein